MDEEPKLRDFGACAAYARHRMQDVETKRRIQFRNAEFCSGTPWRGVWRGTHRGRDGRQSAGCASVSGGPGTRKEMRHAQRNEVIHEERAGLGAGSGHGRGWGCGGLRGNRGTGKLPGHRRRDSVRAAGRQVRLPRGPAGRDVSLHVPVVRSGPRNGRFHSRDIRNAVRIRHRYRDGRKSGPGGRESVDDLSSELEVRELWRRWSGRRSSRRVPVEACSFRAAY